LRSFPALKIFDSHPFYSFRILLGTTRTKVGCDQKRFFHALWSPSCFATSLLLIWKFSVRRAMCRQAIGEKLLEQIRIVPLCNVWVTPVMRRTTSQPNTHAPRSAVRKAGATYLTRLMRETCPEGRLPYAGRLLYSEKFTAAS
jgi:hypothetical protein